MVSSSIPAIMTIKAVFFDVGETLVDESRQWGAWADFLGVTRLTFFGALGAIIERNEHHSQVFDLVQPGLDLRQAQLEREAAGIPDELEFSDFYADALPCLKALREQGYLVGLSGNQPARAEELLHSFGLPVDFVASSASWGVEKPDPRFFERILELTNLFAHEVAYVGDRLDNDVLPVVALGMKSVFIRRGPWGYIHANRPEISQAHVRLETLTDLSAALLRL
jgi:HAD superfamily hydrolase (TIGR01549 family)